MAVAGFAAHGDVDHAQKMANEVKRMSKQLKECQTMAQAYNNREGLLNISVTNVSVFCVFYLKLSNLLFQVSDFDSSPTGLNLLTRKARIHICCVFSLTVKCVCSMIVCRSLLRNSSPLWTYGQPPLTGHSGMKAG